MNIFGLDIGTNSIKAVKLNKVGSRFKLISYGIVPTPIKVIFSEAESDLILLAETIKKLVKDAKIQSNEVVTSLPESKVITTILELPVLSENELAEAIKWEAEQYIPQPLNEVRLAWDIIDTPVKPVASSKMHVLLVAAPLTIIERYQKILNLADLKAVALETETIAIIRALQNDLGDKPALLINLAASSTQFSIIDNGHLVFTRSISTGGTAIARAVATELNLELSQAEEYKMSYGLDETKLQGKVRDSIEPIFEVINTEIKKGLTFFKEKFPEKLINRAFLTGGISRLPGVVAYFAENLSLEVSIANPWSTVDLPPQIAKEVTDESYLYSCVVGLAMKDQ